VDHSLAACEVRKSTICNAGSGVYLLEAALARSFSNMVAVEFHLLRLIDRLAETVCKIQNRTDYRTLLA